MAVNLSRQLLLTVLWSWLGNPPWGRGESEAGERSEGRGLQGFKRYATQMLFFPSKIFLCDVQRWRVLRCQNKTIAEMWKVQKAAVHPPWQMWWRELTISKETLIKLYGQQCSVWGRLPTVKDDLWVPLMLFCIITKPKLSADPLIAAITLDLCCHDTTAATEEHAPGCILPSGSVYKRNDEEFVLLKTDVPLLCTFIQWNLNQSFKIAMSQRLINLLQKNMTILSYVSS